MGTEDDSENLETVAADIVAATRELPRAAFDDVLRRYTHLLCDDEKAGIVAAHINAAIGGPAEGLKWLREMLQRQAREDFDVTVRAAEVDLAAADLRRAVDETTHPRPENGPE